MTITRFDKPGKLLKHALNDWLDDYITMPHQALGRDGAICPFVEPSIRAKSLELVSHAWRAPQEPAAMVRLIDDATTLFRETRWRSANRTLHALVVAITDLGEDGWWLIDEGHRLAKDDAVAKGIMLGQFHPRCRAPAARNPWFPVNRAPLPLIAIRNMAFHDVLFLHDNPRWFEHYQERFGHYFDGSRKIDPKLAELYAEAEQRRVPMPAAHLAGHE